MNPKEALENRINLLEAKRQQELISLKKEFYAGFESLKPVNLIKDTMKSLVQSPNLKSDILNTTLSLATGYLSRKAVLGNKHTRLNDFFGTLLQIGITSLVSNNIPEIKSDFLSLVKNLVKNFFKKK